ncbi:RagB/SusD family nutrient uptake outer membrane protein [Pedobacter africanus]|uniref:SusD family protein n=1 Tax=Pedobacter africanus TaxID=151894 RepID=A0A1W2CU64_9SPHI|nr:RagB/SusD family nutrient uptake outer membrane protein [Pedobacter africanus]SMC88779.1 SusD family protein [Pedobacter africanus]
MKMKYSTPKFKFWIIILSAMLVTSCDSFLEVDLPQSQLSNVSVYENYETATTALTSIYGNLRDQGMFSEGAGIGLTGALANYTDEMVAYDESSSKIYINFYNNTLLPSNTYISGFWNSAYSQIYAANAVFEGAAASTFLTADQKKQLQGEALFIRGMLHFYLSNLFGDIPYVTQTDYKVNRLMARTEIKVVYDLVAADLKNAIAMLPVNYISANKVRPNQLTAKALLSKVYLYQGSWSEAENTASSIIGQSGVYSFEDELNNLFLIGSKETIWQLRSATSDRNTWEGELFILSAGPPLYTALNSVLVNSFANTDLRRSKWMKSVSSGNSTWYYPFKYKEMLFTTVSKEYLVLFRLTEQYMIRAEARAQLDNLQGAKDDLNKIRKRATLDNTVANTKAELLDAILQERRWEFFAELGHRFFDLKRAGKLDVNLSGIKPGWNTTDRLFPIPEKELNTNPNLRPQNPGY